MAITPRWRGKADRLLKKASDNTPGALRRDGSDRPCTVTVIDYSIRERDLRADGAKRALVSYYAPDGNPLDPIPDEQLDMLVVAGEIWRIVKPPEGPRPLGGSTGALFYSLEVVYDTREA